MIINCSVLQISVQDIEENNKLEDLGVEPPPLECSWDWRSIDITTAIAIRHHIWEDADKEPPSCMEAQNCATILFVNTEWITNIPFDQLAVWWKLHKENIEMDYDEENKQLVILF